MPRALPANRALLLFGGHELAAFAVFGLAFAALRGAVLARAVAAGAELLGCRCFVHGVASGGWFHCAAGGVPSVAASLLGERQPAVIAMELQRNGRWLAAPGQWRRPL